jgi:hypothetical protein
MSYILTVLLLAGQQWSNDAFVQTMERRAGLLPGQTKVLPECSCTVRYVGTAVHGHRYTIVIDKLD